jgi:hypothetical protein
MGGEFPNGATTGPARPGPIEDSRAKLERLTVNFEEVPSGASANLWRLPRAEPWFGPRFKCPAHESEPNKCPHSLLVVIGPLGGASTSRSPCGGLALPEPTRRVRADVVSDPGPRSLTGA